MSGGSAGWVVVRGMQVRMRALLQVVVAWRAEVTGLVRAHGRRGPGWSRLTGLMCVRHVGDRWSAGSRAIPATAHPDFPYFLITTAPGILGIPICSSASWKCVAQVTGRSALGAGRSHVHHPTERSTQAGRKEGWRACLLVLACWLAPSAAPSGGKDPPRVRAYSQPPLAHRSSVTSHPLAMFRLFTPCSRGETPLRRRGVQRADEAAGPSVAGQRFVRCRSMDP